MKAIPSQRSIYLESPKAESLADAIATENEEALKNIWLFKLALVVDSQTATAENGKAAIEMSEVAVAIEAAFALNRIEFVKAQVAEASPTAFARKITPVLRAAVAVALTTAFA